MTEKQKHYIEFIAEMTGIPFKREDKVSDYIKAHADEAHRIWELECYARNCEHEDAGDRL